MKIFFNQRIKNFDDLINQLKSLKDESFYNMRSPFHEEIFFKDFYALWLSINIIEEVKNNLKNNGKSTIKIELKGSEKNER